MARLIWGIGQSNNAVSPFQWSAQIGITIFETEKSHYKSGKFAIYKVSAYIIY